MERPADGADTIASAAESRRPVDRTRALLVVAAVALAVATGVSSVASIHFRNQVTRLQGHRLVASSAPTAPPIGGLAAPSSTAGAVIVSAAPAPIPTVSAPPLTMRAFDLEMSRPRVTVYLTTAAADGVGFIDGQLVVTALVRGAQPGARYSLAGGDCDLNGADKVWAQGVADTTGTAWLTGPTWTLPKADQYYLFFQTVPAGATTQVVEGAGLEGVFLLSGLLNPRPGPGSQPCV